MDSLNSRVKEAKNKNQKVVFVSYSAGSVIAYQYMLQKFPYLTTTTFLKDAKFSPEELDYINKHPKKNTCIAALLHSEIGVVTEAKKVIKYKNGQDFIDAYSQLDTTTNDYCAPPDTVYGIINIANVVNLFGSDYLYNDKYFYLYCNRLLYNYLIDNGIVVLSVNFADDAIGLQNQKIHSSNIAYNHTKKGFIAGNNDAQIHANLLKAHSQYWRKPQKTINLIVKAYLDGYRKNIGELPAIPKNKH